MPMRRAKAIGMMGLTACEGLYLGRSRELTVFSLMIIPGKAFVRTYMLLTCDFRATSTTHANASAGHETREKVR